MNYTTKDLDLTLHGAGLYEHQLSYIDSNGTDCTDELHSSPEFANHVFECLKDSPNYAKLRNVLIAKLGLPTDRFQRDNQIAEAVQGVIHERGQLTKLSADLRTQRDALYERLTQVVDVTGEPTLEELVECLVTERGEAVGTVNGLKQLLELPENASNTSLFQAVEVLDFHKPTHDKRYIVHGDIQPCVVLYSDETTTLVRLDENDMMCETSTIEWSDELTYRCQEMLRGEAKRSGGHVSLPTIKLVAQLVRDERILLNDDGGSYQWKPAMDERARCGKPDVKYVASKTCMTCLRISEGTLDLCPQCHTPFGGETDA